MPTRTFQGASAAERVAERRARLLDAALDVVGERGVADFTMTAVCRAAGLTERYFYESFARRDDLLAALFEATSDTALRQAEQAAAAVPAGDLQARAHAAVRATVTLLARDPRSARLYREAVGHPVLAARRQDTVAAFAAFLARLIVEARPLLSPDDLDVTTVLLTAGIVDAVGFWLDGRLAVDAEHLVMRCARLVVAAADFREDR
ncbi:TetR/AcrR family transcriptional regulator [Actinomycetospora sp. NBRC 106378]|uniref:TetR/AcrR family transcriptional regulator n=1 Tax=Actinomycetospora sp. NBRC 106378 TaxID=3032208 RepID=UPI0024A158A4|nr:TetR/AcrR family transcriptional regulator [Actinomycetospora sp. NBRC 106378]GLZ52967.1 putative transcriptional regulator, TetR family protein [Actinomycetospora sp. NBRC 106378]